MKRNEWARAYQNHVARCRNKTDANGNPVKMRLTFEQWCKIWEDSGHWADRGNRSGQYCMSRYGDLGHYEIGNVFIQLHSENSAQIDRSKMNYATFYVNGMTGRKHHQETKDKMSLKLKGSKNPKAILDEDKVRAIKVSLATDACRQRLADEYGVTKMAISAIATGRTWKHVTI